jgi:two-component system chemotaxis response regulator CheY
MGAKTALVVDDEMEVRRFVSNLLTTQLGFDKVYDSPSGEAAVELFAAGEKYDLIFSSWELPKMKGDELLSEMRKIPSGKNTPFIMMSYKKDKESLVKAIQAGVSNYLVKPLSAGVFITKVKKTIVDLEKKEIENFTVKRKNPVDIVVSEEHSLPATLHSVVQSGCVLRTPVPKPGLISIYQNTVLSIDLEGIPFKVPSEVMSLESDRVDASRRQFIMVTFKFGDLDLKLTGKIERLMNSFKAQQDAAKSA